MDPFIIQAIAADQIRERTERAERARRVRQTKAAGPRPSGHSRHRVPVAVFRLRSITLRAAAPAIRLPR